jgi:hypothetical protein
MSRKCKTWTMTEERYLETNYATEPIAKLAKELGRTHNSISCRAAKLKLRRNSKEVWNVGRLEQAKILRALRLILKLGEGPQSIRDVSKVLDLNERTSYRYLALIDSIDIGLKKMGDYTDRKYFIDRTISPLYNQQPLRLKAA